jgi:hypothetical protein
MSFVGAMPVKNSKHKIHQAVIDASGGSLTKSTSSALPLVLVAANAPLLQAGIDAAGGVLPRAGAGGAMSIVGAMPRKKFVPGSAQGVLPVKGDVIEALWATEDDKYDGWLTVSSTTRRVSATGQEREGSVSGI